MVNFPVPTAIPQPPQPVRPPFSVRPLAVTFTVALSVWVLAEIAYIVSLTIGGVALVSESYPRAYAVVFVAFLAESLRAIVALLTPLVVVAFLAWLVHARLNAERLRPAFPQRHAIGWAIVSWFVPVLSFWRPKHVVDDVWRASDPRPSTGGVPRRGTLTVAWWIVWWTALALEVIVLAYLYLGAADNARIGIAKLVRATAELLLMVGGGLTLTITWRITGWQHPTDRHIPPRFGG